MKNLARSGAMFALLLAAAAPVAAQMPPPQGNPAMAAGHHGGRGMHGRGMFASMSEAGRKTMMEAMRGGGDRRAEREQVKAARDRMLTLVEAERLDTGALKRALDDERNAANASRERHQTAMLAGFGKLSVADRKAFVADARAMKDRMEARMKDRRGKRGGMDDMPPPPMM
jgi:Spy/CpxP family protein refolding chaperone